MSSDYDKINAGTEGVRVIRADSPEAASAQDQVKAYYAALKRDSPDVWTELYGSPDAPGPFPDTV